jgi:hypothetical protein
MPFVKIEHAPRDGRKRPTLMLTWGNEFGPHVVAVGSAGQSVSVALTPEDMEHLAAGLRRALR